MNTNQSFKPIWESRDWRSPEWHVEPTIKGSVKIKGIAVPKDAISRNKRKYLQEEIKYAARTWWDSPITINHSNWKDKKNQKGKVNFMEYNPQDGSMEYLGEVWDPATVAELKLYKENPKISKIRKVSIEADYLTLLCPRDGCNKHFTSQEAWANHMKNEHYMTEGLQIPHCIYGRALSIVMAPENAGIEGTTLEVCETVETNGFQQLIDVMLKDRGLPIEDWLLETVITSNMEKTKMDTNNSDAKTLGPPYNVKEQAPAITRKDEPEKDRITVEVTQKLKEAEAEKEPVNKPEDEGIMKETQRLKPFIKESAPKLSLGEPFASYTNFADCVSKNSGKENPEAYCGQIKHDVEETMHFQNSVVGKVNAVIGGFNSLTETVVNMVTEYRAGDNQINNAQLNHWLENKKAIEQLTESINALPQDDVSWNERIKEATENIQDKLAGVTTEISNVANNVKAELSKLQETISNIPKDEWQQPLQEAIAAIKPYDDTPLKEQLAAIPKDDLGWKEIKQYDDTPLKEQIANIKPYDDAPLKEEVSALKTLGDSLTKNLGETAKKVDFEKQQTELTQLKETLQAQTLENAKVKEMYEKNLAAFEKDIKEYYKPIEERTADLEKKLAESTKKLVETTQQQDIKIDNAIDKIKPEYKAHTGKTVKETSVPSSFNPYDPNNKS